MTDKDEAALRARVANLEYTVVKMAAIITGTLPPAQQEAVDDLLERLFQHSGSHGGLQKDGFV